MNKVFCIILILIANSSLMSQTEERCWINVAPGAFHTIALLYDGSLWGWGDNSYGQLGNGNTIGSLVPIKIGNDNDWTSISTYHHHTLAVKKDGTLWAWGLNDFGELGNGSFLQCLGAVRVGNEYDWHQVAAGGEYSLAIKKDGTLWSWGKNDIGQLGLGNTINKSKPTQVGSLNDWVEIDAGYNHSLAVRGKNKDYETYGWGNNKFGQLNRDVSIYPYITTPFYTYNVGDQISTGFAHSLFSGNMGIKSVGNNNKGQLGINSTGGYESDLNSVIISSNYVLYESTPKARNQFTSGDNHSIAIMKEHGQSVLLAWGSNEFGQLGIGNKGNQAKPLPIINSKDWSPIAIYSNSNHNALIGNSVFINNMARAELRIWGMNTYGQLGDGTTTHRNTPILVKCPSITSVNDKTISSSISIFPNPTTGILSIAFNGTLPENMSVINSAGQEYQIPIVQSKIDLSNFSAGVYILKGIVENTTFIKKIILIK